jgi:hypothetical protein
MVGICDRLALAALDMIQQQGKLRLAARWLHSLKVGKILNIQRHDMVEPMKIRRRDLARAQMGYIDPVAPGDGRRAAVGRMPNMPVPGSGRIDLDVDPPSLGLGTECSFGQRRTADIPKANEQDGRHQPITPQAIRAPLFPEGSVR